ncbi:GNAT family N-acetyltransferase [Noviherbaspirillum sp. 17J57-3]|uniref:GNAT family N-acetyltransferase n=2 Tax=Noviherbaspirillum galbum TaxID=2709383 RepID=A0A6B3SMN6_9BURK|nr:GNAT family N-acetyltransferase [Noviherbaspirillum galbum]
MRIVRPTLDHLDGFVAALESGWSPLSTDPKGGETILAQLAADPQRYLDGLFDRHGSRDPWRLADGTLQPPIPQCRYWMWDGEFCGVAVFRWQHGTVALPDTYLGHIGYNVVPWKRGKGYATAAVAQILPVARAEGLPWVDLTTDPANAASQAVILANGGVLVEEFTKPAAYGGGKALRFRIALG